MIRFYGQEPYNVVLVHGGPGAIGLLKGFARELAEGMQMGVVEALQSEYSIDELVEELRAQIEAKTLEEKQMNVQLIRATLDDAQLIWNMQISAFARLLKTYQDVETNPGSEPIEKVIMRLKQPFTYYYLIEADGEIIGAVRVVDKQEAGKNKRISPLFILPEYQGRGFAQQAMREAERLHGGEHWELDTILQERVNCYLYEKMGYRQTGKTKAVNDKLTLVFYEK